MKGDRFDVIGTAMEDFKYDPETKTWRGLVEVHGPLTQRLHERRRRLILGRDFLIATALLATGLYLIASSGVLR